MAKNICQRCGHGYSSRAHQLGCLHKSYTQYRAEARAAYRHQRGSTTYHRSMSEILASGRHSEPITLNAIGNVERGAAIEANLQAIEAHHE